MIKPLLEEWIVSWVHPGKEKTKPRELGLKGWIQVLREESARKRDEHWEIMEILYKRIRDRGKLVSYPQCFHYSLPQIKSKAYHSGSKTQYTSGKFLVRQPSKGFHFLLTCSFIHLNSTPNNLLHCPTMWQVIITQPEFFSFSPILGCCPNPRAWACNLLRPFLPTFPQFFGYFPSLWLQPQGLLDSDSPLIGSAPAFHHQHKGQ